MQFFLSDKMAIPILEVQ